MIDFSYWDGCDPSFLDYDEENQSRAALADILGDEITAGARSMVEVGFGGALDYRLAIRGLVLKQRLSYVGFDGCQKFVDSARESFPEAEWKHNTFADLEPETADITYTMATLEHQPDFVEPLTALIRAARRLCIVNWYRPPRDGDEVRCYNAAERVHYNTYGRQSVADLIESLRCGLEVRRFPSNEVWLITKD